MDARIFIEPQQGATYDDQLAVAQAAEQAGFNALFRSDHYLKMGSVSGLPGPSDAWVTLGALARETTTIRLGTLVASATFKLPGPLAIAVAQIDHMSGGRIELGLGAGWYEAEHQAYGIPFPDLGTRFDALAEQLAVITGLWGTPEGETFDFAGEHFTVADSPGLPKPLQSPHPPIIIGGRGKVKTANLAARYGAEWNAPFVDLETYEAALNNIRTVCAANDRDPDDIVPSAALVVCCGTDEAEIARRARAIGREVDELRANGAAGTPDEVIAKVRSYADVGARRIYLQVLDLSDLEHIALLGDRVVPALAEL